MNIPVHQELPLSVDLLLFIGIYNLHEAHLCYAAEVPIYQASNQKYHKPLLLT